MSPDPKKLAFLVALALPFFPTALQAQLPDAPHVFRERAAAVSPLLPVGSSAADHNTDSAQYGPGNETAPQGGLLSRAVRRFGEDQKNIYTAPFKVQNLKWDAAVVGGTAALVAADESASRNLPKSSAYISQDISNATIFGTGAIVGATWIYGLKTGNEHAKETGELTLESLANTFTVYTAMQVLAGRERPYEGTGEGAFFKHHSINTSFPGGHAMFTWAMAGIVAHEYPHPLVEFLSYGAATAVAASRFTARQHFLSDVAVGSALGYLVSREIFYTRCKLGVSSKCKKD